MITIYGIKNCDTMQKAFKWLNAKGIKYRFHDYRESGIDKTTIERWLKYLASDKVINTRSTTFRELSDAEKSGITDKSKAVNLIIAHPTIVKRPLWDFANETFFLGWDEKELEKKL